MKKGIIRSIGFIALGLVLECLQLFTDIQFLGVQLWVLGIISMIIGVIGVLGYVVIPLLEIRAATLGKFKKQSLKKNNK